MLRRILLVAAPLILAVVAAGGRLALEAEASRAAAVRDPAFLPDGKLLRRVSLGQRLVLADLYWLRTVQYVGETVMSKTQRWEALRPLAEIVTDLDPRFGYAYQVAGSNLGGLAHRYADAEAILQKGMKALPDRWSLPLVHATNKFLFEQDYATAAEYARRAAVVGKKPHLALLAANLSALADTDSEYETALAFLDQAMGVAGTPELEEELLQRRIRIETYQALSTLERAIAEFERRNGRRPFLLSDLVAHGLLPALPADPSGGGLTYDFLTGEVASTIVGPRRPLRVTP